MRQFFRYIVLILLVTYSICLVFQSMADYGLKKMKNTVISEWENIFQGNIKSDIIILGSSRGMVSYDPKIIEEVTDIKSHNLSFNGGSYKIQRLKYDYYRKNNTKPKIIIQNVDLAHFSNSSEIPDSYQFIPYLNEESVKTNLLKLDQNYVGNDQLPVLKYNNNKAFFWRGIKSFFGVTTPKMQTLFDGYHPYEKKYKKDLQNFVRLEKMSNEKDNNKFYAEGLSDLKGFIKENLNDSIIVILAWAPEYKERFKIVEKMVCPLKKELSDLAIKNDGVYFIDLSTDTLSQSSDNFYDSFHLNKKGATSFSTILGENINRLKIKR